MKHRVDALKRAPQHRDITYISSYKFHIVAEILRTIRDVSVHLRTQDVDRAHAMSAREQFVRQVRPDETRSSRDQNVHDVWSPLSIGVCRACAFATRARTCCRA